MDESTTTANTTDDGATAQPDNQEVTQAAENQPTEQSDQTGQQEQPNDEAASTEDDNLAWLQKKGVDPTDPEAVAKIAKMYREAEKNMHQSTAEKAQLQQALNQPNVAAQTSDPTEALMLKVQSLETARAVDTFFNANPDAKQYEETMSQIVADDPNMLYLVQNGYFGIDKLYQLAKGSDTNRDDSLKTAGGREALERVANKQQAKAVTPAATTSALGGGQVTKQNVDSWYAGLSASDRAKPENQQIIADLLSS